MDKRSNADNHLCCFSYSDGRRCRMLRHRDHPGLCPFHSREERQALESERIGTELAASLTGHFLTASDINHVLGKVFTALAQDRISVKKAKALAYLAQLMLHSLRWAKQETKLRYSFDSWQRMLKNSVPLPDPPDPIDPWESADEPASAADAPNVGEGFSPSSTAAGSAFAAMERHSPYGDQPLGVGASACPEPRRAPTYDNRDQRKLSSPHPSANPADARGDSSRSAQDNRTNEHSNEDNTEEPALVFADDRSFVRRT